MAQEHGKVEAFGADPAWVAFWLGLAGLKVPVVIFDIIKYGLRPDMLSWTVSALLPPIIVLVFTSRFRVEYSATHFSYRGWGAKVCVPYADIDHIKIANRSIIERIFVRAFVITKDGKSFSFWPKAFPSRAVQRFLALGEVVR